MTARLPFNRRERRRMAGNFGWRPMSNWGLRKDEGLPAPWAEGDLVVVPADAFMRHGNTEHGFRYAGTTDAVITDVASIDEGDAWYVYLEGQPDTHAGYTWRSGRLHIAEVGRCSWPDDRCIDWMAGVELVDTADPDGLARREQMLADGWTFRAPEVCPTCGRRVP